jgi:hypothetical protein
MTDKTIAKRRARKTRAQWVEELRQCVAEINILQKRTAERLIAFGKALRRAKEDLGHGRYTAMLRDDLKVNVRQAQRVVKIAHDKRITNASNLTRLPWAVSTMVLLLRLSDDAFAAGILDGSINPDMTAADAKSLIKVRVKEFGVPLGVPRHFRHRPLPPRLEIDRLNATLGRVERTYRRLVDLGALDSGQLETALEHLAGLRGLLPKAVEPTKPSAAVVHYVPASGWRQKSKPTFD